jgi:hypothetical protein
VENAAAIAHTAHTVAKILKREGKSRMYLEKICWVLEEEKEIGMQWEC